MKKVHLVGLALLAVLAFCAFAAVSASASEYLVEAAKFVGALSAETTGKVTLLTYESEASSNILNEIECAAGTFDGTIESKTALIQKLLNSAGEEITLTVPRALLCSVLKDGGQNTSEDCEEGTNNAEIFPQNLNWSLALTLMSETDWESTFPATAGYEVLCKVLLGITGEGLCEGAQTVLLTNEGAGTPSVLGVFQAITTNAARASCSFSGIAGGKIGEVEGTGNTWALEGATRLATSLS